MSSFTLGLRKTISLHFDKLTNNLLLSDHNNMSTQHNSTRRRVELCHYKRAFTEQLSIGVVELYNDGVGQVATFTYLIY